MDSLYHVGVKPQAGQKKKNRADWSVYIVRCRDGSYYTGAAKDVASRVAVHNKGKGAAYTRSRLPVVLRYREDGFTRSGALTREAQIKSLRRPEKENLITSS